jgi:hypothetical protein
LIQAQKPPGKPLRRRTTQANARKSAVHSVVEHVLARQKGSLFIPTIGKARVRTNIGFLRVFCVDDL